MNDFRITAVNIESIFGEYKQNLENHIKWIEKHKDSQLILFPELSLSGYSSNPEELDALENETEQTLNELCARTHDFPEITVAVGTPLFKDQKIYIAHHLIRNGVIQHSHLKRILGPSEENCFSSGSPANAINEYEVHRGIRIGIGIQICAESHSPESSARLADSGAGLLLMPFASPRETPVEKLTRFKKYLPARAYDNSCFLACCNLIRVGRKTGTAPGAAMIIGPRGDILAETAASEENSCTSRISPDEILKIKDSSMGWFRSWRHIKD
ncbi:MULTISPECIES: nitrilase-related carbon-nitrogen hydrolase [unclassified Oceanispirochaeta]|uniref:nitrilase-related carbon-nitrogen hydrolase n=1 Tax=unclassified Oceanispirochaeta TaxID=2635722 RepID=UPI000E0963FA|nr:MULTISPECIES: nitrilase-related carbon-nitrogen hydrolase [unclassified Oceanispirochaeta]MBF9017173.1 hypothetical protein [Oceanispirochaeta sp. M2]NPD73622.1 hypothetical protein [Oceanispirochaeta sp. M1]RDG30725.1 hypothetical protein DV872_16125 [Oceanispirochaeta sp. M1]